MGWRVGRRLAETWPQVGAGWRVGRRLAETWPQVGAGWRVGRRLAETWPQVGAGWRVGRRLGETWPQVGAGWRVGRRLAETWRQVGAGWRGGRRLGETWRQVRAGWRVGRRLGGTWRQVGAGWRGGRRLAGIWRLSRCRPTASDCRDTLPLSCSKPSEREDEWTCCGTSRSRATSGTGGSRRTGSAWQQLELWPVSGVVSRRCSASSMTTSTRLFMPLDLALGGSLRTSRTQCVGTSTCLSTGRASGG